MPMNEELGKLCEFLRRIPTVNAPIMRGVEDGRWWVKLTIDIEHRLAWSVIQELAHVLNHSTMIERPPTLFMPVSPPPYMNGGPREYLSWIIESRTEFSPADAHEWIEGHLPRPVDDLSRWPLDARK